MTRSDIKVHVIMVLALLGLFVAMFGLIYLGNNMFPTKERVINCSLAEISPDFTTEMRELCRKARSAK